VLVDDLADLHHLFLEHAVRGRVGHHDRGQAVAVLLGVEADVLDVDVAVGIGWAVVPGIADGDGVGLLGDTQVSI
jgi:hypothetical protein